MRPSVLIPVAVLVLFAGEAVGDQPSADSFPAVFELSSLLPANGGTGATGFVLNGIDVSGFSGVSVSSAGDVNGDGVDDLIIGAFGASPSGVFEAGESYVVFGGAGVGAGGTIELSSLDGIRGFAINGNQPCLKSGRAVSSAGDFNGDGIDDLIISDWNDDCDEAFSFRGRGYMIFGGTDVGAGGTIELSSLDGANGFVFSVSNFSGCSVGSVSSAGDVNDDGIDDVILGAPPGCGYCPCQDSGGQSYVIFGGTDVGEDGQLTSSSLDGTNGFVLRGIDAFDHTGSSVSSAGDVNGDGIDDLIIGATGGAPNGNSVAGESYVVFGGADVGAGGLIELSSLDGVHGFVINGIDVADQSGGSVAGAGDVNDDGVDDLIIGASGGAPNGRSVAGESYVVFGGADVGAGGVIELSSLDGANGFVLNGIDRNDLSGLSVASAGDVNGDGIPDLIIGATGADPNGNSRAGESYVVFGGAGLGAGGVIELSSLDGVTGFVLNGIDADDFSGASVASAGDVNGDGIADLLIGASGADPNGQTSAGESYVVFGRQMNRPPECPSTVRIDLWPPDHRYEELDLHEIVGVSDPDGDAISFSIEGIAQDESIRGRGDGNAPCDAEVSGDSTFRVRRERQGDGDGRVYTVDYMAHDGKGGACRGVLEVGVAADPSGGPAVNGGALFDSLACDSGEADDDPPSADPFPAVFELSCLLPANGGTGETGFVLNGVSGFSGASVSSAGDVNGDGVDDLIIGASRADPNGVFDAGQSYVVFGGAGVGAGGTIELSSLDGIRGFVINGDQPCQGSGNAVSSAGDVNGDGIDDLMISDWDSSCEELPRYFGAGYVIFGGTDIGAGGTIELSSLDGANGFVVLGLCDVFSLSPAGDVNGDGIDDVIMGAPPGCGYCGCQDVGGQGYVIFGGADVGGDGQLISYSLDGTNGFVLQGMDAFDYTGSSVSSAGDVNGDGIDDLIIGATGADPNGNSGAGESYVVFGGPGLGAGGVIELSSLDGVTGFVINGIDAFDFSGGSVAGTGDVNDDGVDDLIIGATGADPNGNDGAGKSYVVFGGANVGAGGTIELSSLDGVKGFVLNGIGVDDFSGGPVASAGDVNGDGIPDLIIGAAGGDPNGISGAGESYVVFGGAGLGTGGVIELSSLDGVNGFVLNGIDAGDSSGRSVASAGDVNDDGVDDLIIGATGADPNGNFGAGESYVVFGHRMNRPPECPSTVRIDLWPPDHRYEELDLREIVEVSDPDGDAISFSIEGIAQDESIRDRGDGNTPCDGEVSGDSTFRVRRERRGGGDGRVYTVDYMAHDGKQGACRGVLEVGVAADPFGGPAVNGGALFDSLACDPGRHPVAR